MAKPEMSGMTKVLIIDDDEVSRNLIANHFSKMGIDAIDQFENGDTGWEALCKDRYDFIVLDWKLPGVSGLALFNRIRSLEHYRTTPLLVVSGFLEKNDFRLLQEFPCTGLMEKPFTKVLFQNQFDDLVREFTWYGQNVSLVDSLVEAVEKDGKKAESLIKQVIKQAPNPIPLALIAARRMVGARMLQNAENILRGILKIDEGNLIAMNELGKALNLQGQHKAALEVLRKAAKLSPQNINRLCLMGEVELNLREVSNAKAYFEKALEIDSASETAKAGLVVARNMKEALGSASPTHVTASFASILNTMGIALVRNGQYARGVEQYRAALAFLHSNTDSARVAFNLGLGFLRWGKPNEALPWFQKSEKMAPKTFGKSAGYINKLLERGGVAAEEVDLRDEAAFGRAEEAAKKPQVTVDDDDDDDNSNIIPFPSPPAAPEAVPVTIDDIPEETVGGSSEVVLRPNINFDDIDIEDLDDDDTSVAIGALSV